jgi:isopenicillin N synthase-like dioxygenase
MAPQGLSQGTTMLIYQPPRVLTEIPVVDLAASFEDDPSGFDTAAHQIHKACRQTGFFYVAHHGVPQALIDETFLWSRRLFDLPPAERMALDSRNSASAAGYSSGTQQLDSQDTTSEKAPPDLKESFGFGMELPGDHPLAVKRVRDFGHNQWPAGLPGFRTHMLDYQAALRRLRLHLLRLLARSLDLPDGWFLPHFEIAANSIRLLKYPPQPPDAAFNQIGAGAHTDWGAITILAQDEAGGLEVRCADGTWVEAAPIAGTFVVNLGDLMARWSNGVYNANMHRVKNNRSGRDRYSIVSFNNPNPDAVIEPVPGCVTEAFPRKFATCTAQEHLNEMFRRSYGYLPGASAA